MVFELYIFFANDLFIVLFGCVIMAQYEIITKAFENIGYEEQITQSHEGK